MRRGTTPTITYNVDIDLTSALELYVTITEDGVVMVERSINDVTITSKSVSISLTQEETLKFNPGKVLMQIRARMPDGAALASNIMMGDVAQILKDGVI